MANVNETVDGVKMSKSLGNFITISDALKQYRPEVIRMFMLSAHYSNPIDYSEEAMTAAERGWERLHNAVRLVRQKMTGAPAGDSGNSILPKLDETRQRFIEAMDDDFGTPGAIAALQDLTRDVNALLNGDVAVGADVLQAIDAIYQELGGTILGILPRDGDAQADGSAEREAALVELLIQMRADARKAKNYAESDRIRDELARIGVVLEDRADGTVWRTS